MFRKSGVLFASLLCAACGGGGNDAVGSQQLAQVVVNSNGDLTKYVGGWSSCTAQPNGQYVRNNIKFSMSGTDLLFTPAIGIVGTYSDAACTQDVLGQTYGITSIEPLRISTIGSVDIPQQSGSQFGGKADVLPDIGQPAFKFAGFDVAGTSVWFSPSNSFSGTVVRYNKQ